MRRAPLRLNALTVAKLIRYMQEVPCNVTEGAEACGLGIAATRRFILALEKERAIHVSSWEQDGLGRYTTKVYAFGHGKDAPKPPPPISLQERRRNRTKRNRQMRMQNAICTNVQA